MKTDTVDGKLNMMCAILVGIDLASHEVATAEQVVVKRKARVAQLKEHHDALCREIAELYRKATGGPENGETGKATT